MASQIKSKFLSGLNCNFGGWYLICQQNKYIVAGGIGNRISKRGICALHCSISRLNLNCHIGICGYGEGSISIGLCNKTGGTIFRYIRVEGAAGDNDVIIFCYSRRCKNAYRRSITGNIRITRNVHLRICCLAIFNLRTRISGSQVKNNTAGRHNDSRISDLAFCCGISQSNDRAASDVCPTSPGYDASAVCRNNRATADIDRSIIGVINAARNITA